MGARMPSDGPIAAVSMSSLRRGSVVVLAAVMLIVIFAFLAFVVDIGFILLTEAQLQTAADAAALAAARDLTSPLTHPVINPNPDTAIPRSSAVQYASYHKNGNLPTTSISATQDVRFGHRYWHAASGQWVTNWGMPPYNVVEVTASRKTVDNTGLPLFFAPLLGVNFTSVTVKAEAALAAADGFRVASNIAPAPVLPFAVDLDRWFLALTGAGVDALSYVEGTAGITAGADGLMEINIYPMKDGSLPAGNCGTINLGAANNSAADISRQIVEGLNADDLAPFGGVLSIENGPIIVSGDPGLGASFDEPLRSIIGQTRAIPLFDLVSGQGATTTYRIVKFVGARIMDVKLTGPMSQKRLLVQPAKLSTGTAEPSKFTVIKDSIISTPRLVR